MELTPAASIDIERLVVDGLHGIDRRRLRAAFEAACAELFETARFAPSTATAHERLVVSLPPGAGSEEVGRALAVALAGLVTAP